MLLAYLSTSLPHYLPALLAAVVRVVVPYVFVGERSNRPPIVAPCPVLLVPCASEAHLALALAADHLRRVLGLRKSARANSGSAAEPARPAGACRGPSPPPLNIGVPASGVAASADSLLRIPQLFTQMDRNGNGVLGKFPSTRMFVCARAFAVWGSVENGLQAGLAEPGLACYWGFAVSCATMPCHVCTKEMCVLGSLEEETSRCPWNRGCTSRGGAAGPCARHRRATTARGWDPSADIIKLLQTTWSCGR